MRLKRALISTFRQMRKKSTKKKGKGNPKTRGRKSQFMRAYWPQKACSNRESTKRGELRANQKRFYQKKSRKENSFTDNTPQETATPRAGKKEALRKKTKKNTGKEKKKKTRLIGGLKVQQGVEKTEPGARLRSIIQTTTKKNNDEKKEGEEKQESCSRPLSCRTKKGKNWSRKDRTKTLKRAQAGNHLVSKKRKGGKREQTRRQRNYLFQQTVVNGGELPEKLTRKRGLGKHFQINERRKGIQEESAAERH